MLFEYSDNFDMEQSYGLGVLKDVLVLGSGMSGLCAAFYLKQAGLEVNLMERGNHPGGFVQSHRSDTGFLSELGPNTLQLSHPCVLQLIESLGIADEMVCPPEGLDRLIARNKTLVALPKTLWQFIQTPLFTTREKMRILSHGMTPSFSDINQLTLTQYFGERYGRAVVNYLIDPFVAGIYGGNPSDLSLKYSFPKLFELVSRLEPKRKSLLFYILRKGLYKKTPASVSFKEGLFTLPSALVKALGPTIQYEARIKSITYHRKKKQWSVSWYTPGERSPHYAEYKHLWVTIPSYTLKTLPMRDPYLRSFFERISVLDLYAPISSLTLGIKQSYFKHIPQAFGFLTPACEHLSILGALFTSSIFPNRAPEGYISLTAFAGGARERVYATMNTETFQRLTLTTLNTLGLIYPDTQTSFKHHTVWTNGIPQYTYNNYSSLHSKIQELSQMYPTLHLSGNYLRGVSLSACIHYAYTQAEAIAKDIKQEIQGGK